ncbi:hypothetical protein BsWGS_00462 [Bradybaena similaris]
MAQFRFRCHTSLSFLIICVLIKTIQSQELNNSNQECDGCWHKLDAAVNMVVRSMSNYHRHRVRSDLAEETDESNKLSDAVVPHLIFRRSLSSSTSSDCLACWLVLKRLLSYNERSQASETTNFRQLVKKTMLNNGWV